MLTFLDLLVIVAMALAAASLLAVCLMFLVRNRTVKQVCFYLTAVLGLVACYIGLRIFWPEFMVQSVLAVLLGLGSIGSLVLMHLGKENTRLVAQILAAVSLIAGMINAFS